MQYPKLTIRILRVIGFAIGYYVAGRLGLLLAIPPGYATVVWPASGVAIAGVLLFGSELCVAAFAGSLAVNMETSFDGSSSTTAFSSLALTSTIALGASLQAWLGAYLVRKHVGFPGPFGTPKGVFYALVLAGPVSCIVSASMGVFALNFFGPLPLASALSNWFTWWGGDTIGILIAMPLLQVATAPASKDRGQRVALVAIPLFMAVLGTVVFHLQVKAYDQSRVQVRFHRKAATIEAALQRTLHEALERLYFTSAAMDVANGKLSRPQFSEVVRRFVNEQDVITNLSWNLRVEHKDRSAYEQSIREEGFPDFSIREIDAHGSIVRAADRPEYFVVHFLEPLRAENSRVHGFDTASEAVRRIAVHGSRDSGRVTATGPISLIQGYRGEKGFIIFLPLYRGSQPDTIAGRRSSWAGALVSVIRVPKLIAEATRGFESSHFELQLEDRTDDHAGILYSSFPKEESGKAASRRKSDHYQYDGKIEFGGRTWKLTCRPTSSYRAEHESLAAWGLLAGGLLIASGFGIFLLVVTGRTAVVEELVAHQTTEIREAKAAAESASRAKGEFLANMSHEIRTPLNVILGTVELLLDGELDTQQKELLSTVHTSGQHLLVVINDILDFSKIEAGKLSLDITDFRLNDCVTQSLQMFEAPMSLKGLRAVASVDLDIPEFVRGDVGRLRQILLNLVGNSFKFTHQGQVTVKASLKTIAEQSIVIEFSVSDTGIGIPADKLETIFNPFEQGDGSTTRKYGGSGLGLSIVKRLVTMMNGRIWIQSDFGRGTTIYFEIVLERVNVAPEPRAGAFEEPSSEWLRGLKVLIADDSPPNQILIRNIFDRRGVHVSVCGDGHAAIELVKNGEFDLVLMDMQMPLIGGPEAARAIRQWETKQRHARTPIIALTANALRVDRDVCFAAGMDGYVAKPVSRPMLFREVDRVLTASRQRVCAPMPNQILQRVEGNIDLLSELIEAYATHSPLLLKQMQLASDQGNLAALRKSTHALRSATILFGESQLQLTLDLLETGLRADPPRQEHQLLQDIPEQFSALLAQLHAVLSSGNGCEFDRQAAVSGQSTTSHHQ